MPIIRFHAVSKDSIINAGEKFQQAIADKFQTNLENVTFEVIESTFISSGEVEKTLYPVVEILSFQRAKEVEQEVVKEIVAWLETMGYVNSDIFYQYILKSGYYVNGELL